MHSSDVEDSCEDENSENNFHRSNLPTTSPFKRPPVIDNDNYEQSKVFDQSPFEKFNSLKRNLNENGTPISKACDNNGYTLLHHQAAQRNKIKPVKLLFEKSQNSLDPNAVDPQGRTPLHVAIQENNVKFICEAIKDGRTDLSVLNSKDDKNTFEYIFETNHFNFEKDLLCLLLIKGIHESDNQCYQWFFYKVYGNNFKNLLHLLAQYGCSRSIKYILSNGLISPNSRDNKSRTPLMIAAYYKQNDGVKALLEDAWMQIDATDVEGNTVFDYVFRNCRAFENLEMQDYWRDLIVVELIEACHVGNRRNSIDLVTWKPAGEDSCGNLLHYCASTGCIKSVRYLLDEKIINIHARDRIDTEFKRGKTPLHYAIQNKNLEIIKLLTSYSAFCVNKEYDLWLENVNDAINDYITWSTMSEIDECVRACRSIVYKLKTGTTLENIAFLG